MASDSDEGIQQLVETSHMSIDANATDEAVIVVGDEPLLKRARSEQEASSDISSDMSVKQILFNINKAICLRLDAIEKRLNDIDARTQTLEQRVECELKSEAMTGSGQKRNATGAVIVGLAHSKRSDASRIKFDGDEDGNVIPAPPGNVTLITLNTEEDFPNGTWLGDESNPEQRVRCAIMPSDLLHIHSNCRTAEKMSVTLLDYLFDRETQAGSNLSGTGRHGKKQLDPLMVYGIRCHIIHKFGITESDWHRIKQNLDSKCRTAFRRRTRGQPLHVKAFRGKAPPVYIGSPNTNSDSLSNVQTDTTIHIQPNETIAQHLSMPSQMTMVTQHGEVQIIQATPEQIAQLREAHNIQLIDSNQVLEQLKDDEVGLPLQVVSTEGNTEVIHIQSSRLNDLEPGAQIIVQDGQQVVIDEHGHQLVMESSESHGDVGDD